MMLRILGSAKRLCDGWTRRDMLRAGGLGLTGLQLGDLLRLRAESATPAGQFGKAKACILLYLYGAPSQLETFDLKPNAPTDIRSQFQPIATSVPGLQICEHLPRVARIMHQTSLIRSMSHPYNIHSAAYSLTGTPKTDIPMELNPHDGRHWPFFGSVLDYLQARSGKKSRLDTPANFSLPWRFSSRSPTQRGGPYGGFLGNGFDPVCANFVGDAPKGDPYRGITVAGRFELGQPGTGDMTLDFLNRRRSLLQQFDDKQRGLNSPAARGFDRHQEMAFNLLTSPRLRRALDIEAEPIAVRDRYGLTLFGQGVLAARRLVEQGVQLVTVFWDEFAETNSSWDTHLQQVPSAGAALEGRAVTRIRSGLLSAHRRFGSARSARQYTRCLYQRAWPNPETQQRARWRPRTLVVVLLRAVCGRRCQAGCGPGRVRCTRRLSEGASGFPERRPVHDLSPARRRSAHTATRPRRPTATAAHGRPRPHRIAGITQMEAPPRPDLSMRRSGIHRHPGAAVLHFSSFVFHSSISSRTYFTPTPAAGEPGA
jgi:hypothetical protein